MELRSTNLDKLEDGVFDAFIIGGGINGAVSAAALSARGAHVALIDRGDFAGATSMHSSNLAWGGIKYLESGEVGLVRKLCMSRNDLIEAFPSIVQEIRFVATIERGFRWPLWMLYLGAWLYWLIGGFFTHAPRYLTRQRLKKEIPNINAETVRGGFEYSDAILRDNDSRFVFGFVRQALTHGCIAANYVESTGGRRDEDGLWTLNLKDRCSDRTFKVRTRIVINACGPYVDAHNKLSGESTSHRHVFSKGIHLVVNRVTDEFKVLAFFADDGRLFFAIPMGARTVLGTTDTRVPTPETTVNDEDRDFVLSNINKRLKLSTPITKDDIIAERCGVRPLVLNATQKEESGDWTKLSRKHAIDVNHDTAHISIFGGKLTDCINVGNEVALEVRKLGVSLPYHEHKWYGEPPQVTYEDYLHQARLMELDERTEPHASEPLSQRLWRRYGARAIGMLEDIRRDPTMADVLIENSEYIRCEIYRTAKHEMVMTLDDFLRRRSRIAQVVPREVLKDSVGLKEACEILFGSQAQKAWETYFGDDSEEPRSGEPAATVARTA